MLCKTRVIDGYIVRIIHDFHRNMWIGKFENSSIENVYGDTEGEVYKEIYNAIARYQNLPIPYPDDEYKLDDLLSKLSIRLEDED